MIKKLFFLGIFSLTISLHAQIGADEVIIVQDLNPGSGNSNPSIKLVSGGLMYISMDEASGTNTPGGADLGRELWVYNGTNLSFVKDLRSGDGNSFPDDFFELNGNIYFGANNGNTNNNNELYTTDGTAAGTVSASLFAVDGEGIDKNVVVGNKVYLQAKPTTGSDVRLVEWDGVNAAITVPNVDPASGVEGLSSDVLIELNGKIYMEMEYTTDGLGDELYEYDPATDRFTLVKDIRPGATGSNIAHLVKLGSEIYFEAREDGGSTSLFKSDGTTAGTVKIASAANVSGLASLYAWDGKVFMEGDTSDDADGDQLWVYNPTDDSMTNLSALAGNHDPSDFLPGGDGWLYYRGELAASGDGYLFRTNGVTLEPVNIQIKDIDDLALFNGKLYFEGDNGVSGNELFVWDNVLSTTSTIGFNHKISIYPNPSKNTINVSHSLITELNYEIFDIAGRSVIQGKLLNNTINHNLNSGIYILNLSDKTDSFTQKIVVE